MTPNLASDPRTVMTLDAGGTSFKFSAIRGKQAVVEPFRVPSQADDLEACLGALRDGFQKVKDSLPDAPVAISFAFPGPADYPRGIIGDLPNLPCFRGGIALGPMLEDHFGIPTFINNDGDLFVYGEAIAGFLPYVNELLVKAGSPKRYQNLFGVTLGTGFGGGITRAGELFRGDNVSAAEVWLLRNKLSPETNAEEGACIRAVQRAYAEAAGIAPEHAPSPKEIYDISCGRLEGSPAAAQAAYDRLGKVVGDAMAQALTLIDGLAVIGGGISGAAPAFLPALLAELNGDYTSPTGEKFPRLVQRCYNLEDAAQLERFLTGDRREIAVPGSSRTLSYDPLPRIGVGLSRLGTSEAVSIGAYSFALQQLSKSWLI